jgi:small multidrug resistance pump
MIYPHMHVQKSLNFLISPVLTSTSLVSPIYTDFVPRNDPVSMLLLDRPDLYLIGSILLETLSTCCLKYTIADKRWFFPVYAGYGLAFYTFPKTLNKYPLSVAYTIWCGGGIILTNIFDRVIFKEMITYKKLVSSLIILFGIVVSS